MQTDGPEKPGHFARLNALAQQGWLAVLTGSEMALWIAYEKFADRDGVAYPDRETLGTMLGHASGSHVGRVRQRLAEYGILEVLESGGGRGNRFKIRLLVPPHRQKTGSQIGNLFGEGTEPDKSGKSQSPKGSQSDTVSALLKGAEPAHKGCRSGTDSAQERVPIRRAKGADPARKGCRSGAPYKEDPPNEPPREPPMSSAAAQRSADRPREADGGTKKPSVDARAPGGPGKRTGERKLSDEHLAVRDAFTAWFVSEAYPAVNEGVEYEFAAEPGRNAAAVLTILGSKFVAWDVDRAKAVAREFLAEPDVYLASRGRPLYDLASRLGRFAALAVRRANGKANAPPRQESAQNQRRENGNGNPAIDEDDYAIPVRRMGADTRDFAGAGQGERGGAAGARTGPPNDSAA